MSEIIKKIASIMTLDEYIKKENELIHLFEVQLPPAELKDFKPRFNFEQGGTLLVGDLILDIQEEQYFESHPFPEWVVQLLSRDNPGGKAYLIVPNLPERFTSRLNNMNYEKRIKKIEEKLEVLSIEDLFAFEYQIGINIKVPANIPHTFIAKIDFNKGEKSPYLQVFEPNLKIFNEVLKLKTPYYKLPFKVKI